MGPAWALGPGTPVKVTARQHTQTLSKTKTHWHSHSDAQADSTGSTVLLYLDHCAVHYEVR